MARGHRQRIARSVYRDDIGRSSVVNVGKHCCEKRWAFGTDLKFIQDWQKRNRRRLGKLTPASPRGSLTADIARYVRQIQHLASWRERRAELPAWEQRSRAQSLEVSAAAVAKHLANTPAETEDTPS